MASIASMTTGPGGMVQQSLSVGCVLMDVRREVVLSGAVVASTAVRSAKVNALIAPKDGTVEDGDGGSRACTCSAHCGSARPGGALGTMRDRCVRPLD